MPDSDDELFRLEMDGVKPMEAGGRVSLKSTPENSPGMAERRRAAEVAAKTDSNPFSGEHVTPVEPLQVISFQRPGIQHGVFKNLRLGKYQTDVQLDLHRMTVEQARRALFQFLHDCTEHGIRCALINHGKGEGRQPQPALLKSYVAHWLPLLERVLAFHSAQKRHGGVGATYVLLRKSEREREKNRELHAAKRS